jgi:hypothetical protein
VGDFEADWIDFETSIPVEIDAGFPKAGVEEIAMFVAAIFSSSS